MISLLVYGLVLWAGYKMLNKLFDPKDRNQWLFFCLAPGVGLGVICGSSYLELLILGRVSAAFEWAMFIVLLIYVLWPTKKMAGNGAHPSRHVPKNGWMMAGLWGMTFLLWALVAAKSLYGTGIDAWAIWKLKARYLFYSPNLWQDMFRVPLNFSHLDYPLFYPLSLLFGWRIEGQDSMWAPLAISGLFTMATAGALVAYLLPLGRARAWLAGALLVSTPHFIGMGASQYADILVAYFALTTAICLIEGFRKCSGRHLVIAGFLAGANSFVKNEGILLFLAFFIALCGVSALAGQALRKDRGRGVVCFVLGALPYLAATLSFKCKAAFPNDVITVERLITALTSAEWLRRLPEVLAYLGREILEENKWVYGWVIFGAFLIGHLRQLLDRKGPLLLLVSFMIVAAGYVAVYLITPIDLMVHLTTSVDRLMLQLLPLAILLMFDNWYPPELILKRRVSR